MPRKSDSAKQSLKRLADARDDESRIIKRKYPKRSDEDMLSDEESDNEDNTIIDEPVKPQLYKLVKGKYIFFLKLCGDCQNALFNSKKKFFRSDGRLQVAIGLCDSCVQLNCQITDMISPPKKNVSEYKRD